MVVVVRFEEVENLLRGIKARIGRFCLIEETEVERTEAAPVTEEEM
jgi:hypothetical protein